MGCTYARKDLAEKMTLDEFDCARSNCRSKPIKTVRSRNGLGVIALCRKHLEEYRNGSDETW